MGAIKLTFDGANNTAKMDALLGAYLTNYQNGIIKGLGNELAYSFSNGRITFKDGFICVYGRRIYIEDGTSIDIDLDSNKYGFVVLNINTTTNDVSISKVEASGTTPKITQTNLLTSDGLYQFVMCAYIKSTSSIDTYYAYSRSYIYTYSKTIDEMREEYDREMDYLRTEVEEGHGMKFVKYSSQKGNKYSFDIGMDLQFTLICIPINNKVVVTIPGMCLSRKSSVSSIQYTIDGGTYSLTYENTESLILQVGHKEHKLTNVYIFY